MLKRRPTSYDVAARAGVSRSTVSLVLGKHPQARVSAETRQRIISAASELGYVADAKGRALATGRTGRIALIPIDPRAMPSAYYGRIIQGAAAAATDAGCHILLFTAEHESVELLVSDIMGGMADGAILVGREPEDPAYHLLDRAGFPVVAASFQPTTADAWFVDVDHFSSGREMASHLAGLGHRQAAYVGPSLELPWLAAFRRGLEDSGALKVSPVSLPEVYEGVSPEAMFRLIHKKAPKATVWVTVGDDVAAALAANCQARGLRIPEDLSIATRNRLVHADAATPSITGIREDICRVGQLALEMCQDRLNGKERRQVLLSCDLVVKDSTGPARRA